MSKAISNSEGYVYFNKQRKKWNACYPVYDVESGKDKIKTKTFKTEEEAKEAEKAAKEEAKAKEKEKAKSKKKTSSAAKKTTSAFNKTVNSAANTIGREIGKKVVRGIFDTFFKG